MSRIHIQQYPNISAGLVLETKESKVKVNKLPEPMISQQYFNSPTRTTKDYQHMQTEQPLKSQCIKRSEYSQNAGAYSPIRHIGNSNTRMSF